MTLLPEPDSPISATTSPRCTRRSTPLTACTGLRPPVNVTLRFWMSTKASSVMPQPPSHGRPSARCPLQTRGNAVISQDGREAAMSPGDFAVYDSIRPYTLRSDDDSQKLC